MSALRAGTATDVGLVRANNQDSALVASPLFAVADGMGGHAAGEVASATACQALEEAWATGSHTPEALVEAARQANRAVFARAEGNPELHGMGTTLVTVALTGGPDHETVAIAHVGDSRVYRLRGGQLDQVTADHSLVAELVADGQLAPEEAEYHPQRHVLSRALGVYPEVEVDLSTEAAVAGDRYLLCSDGLSREVPDRTIAEILRRQTDPGDAARELVDEAKANGGSDNVTVVIIDIVAGDGGVPADGDSGPLLAGAAAVGAATPGGLDATRATPRADDTAVLPAVPPAPTPRRKRRLVTVRLVAFILALLAVVVIAIGGIDFYARSSYFVGLQGNQLVIFQGRPGGVLWFHPTVKERTGVTTAQIEQRHLSDLQAGMTESSLKAARQYVSNLTAEERAARGGTPTTPSTTPDTTPTTLPPSPSTVTTTPTAPTATPVT